MNMFTYVHHKNQPPQVAGIPTNSRFFSWNLSIDGPMLPSPPLVSGRIPNPIALFPFKLRAPTPILSQHTSPKSPYTIRISQLMSTDIEQHVQSPTPSPTPSQKPPKCSLRSSAFSPTTRSYSALKAKRWRWNGVSPKVIASRGCPLLRAEPWTSKGRKRFLLSVEDVWIIFQKTSSYQMYPNVECVRMCSLDQPTSSLSLEQSAASAEEVTWFEFVSSMLLNWSHEARANTHAICLGWHLEPSGQKKCHPSSSDAENNISSWVDFLHLTPFPKRIEISL